jgi:transposase, IS30 family
MSKDIAGQMWITFYERQIIEIRLRGKWGVRRIARYLGRPHSTISREITRNSPPDGKYLALYAQNKAESRRGKTNKRILNENVYLKKGLA